MTSCPHCLKDHADNFCKREEFAAYAHRSWSRWMKYMFDKCTTSSEDSEYVIPKHLAERWIRQMNTIYGDLPDNEKLSDRLEADSIMNILRHTSGMNYDK